MINFWKDQTPPDDTSLIWIRLNENRQVAGYFRYEDGKWIVMSCGGLKRYIIDQEHLKLIESILGGDLGEIDTLEEVIIELNRKVYTEDLARVAFTGDYLDLLNYPIISNNIEADQNDTSKIASAKAVFDAIGIKYGTTEYWNSQAGYIPKEREIIIYSDYRTMEKNGHIVNVPGIKIGTGNAYVQDLPFMSEDLVDALYLHIADTDVHVTPEEKEMWNNKLNVDDNAEVVSESLVFNRN